MVPCEYKCEVTWGPASTIFDCFPALVQLLHSPVLWAEAEAQYEHGIQLITSTYCDTISSIMLIIKMTTPLF